MYKMAKIYSGGKGGCIREKRVKKISTNKYKAKGLGQAFFPKGLRGARGQSLLGAIATVVNYVYLRNPFADSQSN